MVLDGVKGLAHFNENTETASSKEKSPAAFLGGLLSPKWSVLKPFDSAWTLSPLLIILYVISLLWRGCKRNRECDYWELSNPWVISWGQINKSGSNKRTLLLDEINTWCDAGKKCPSVYLNIVCSQWWKRPPTLRTNVLIKKLWVPAKNGL